MCSESRDGKHTYCVDLEYDPTGKTINCLYCGELKPEAIEDKVSKAISHGQKQSSSGWDRTVAAVLRKEGLSQDQIGVVIGIIAEHRQTADLQGHHRGYEAGYSAGYSKGKKAK